MLFYESLCATTYIKLLFDCWEVPSGEEEWRQTNKLTMQKSVCILFYLGGAIDMKENTMRWGRIKQITHARWPVY